MTSRVYERGDRRVEIAVDGGTVVVRTFGGGALVDEVAAAHDSPLAAKWDADRRAGEQLAAGFARIADPAGDAPRSQAELMAMLAANPDDLASYLVLADWLSARGDPWGQVIAIQHALATLPRFGAGARRDELDRLDAFARFEHAARLWGRLGETVVDAATQTYAFGLVDADWHCGFVRAVRLFELERLAAELVDELARLDIMRLARRLEISGGSAFRPRVDAARIAPLVGPAGLPAVRELVVEWTANTDALCAALAAGPLAPTLEVLVLDPADVTDAGVAALAAAPFAALRRLKLTGRGPGTAAAALARCATSVDVRVSPHQVADDGR